MHLEGSLDWSPSLLFSMSGTQRGPPWLVSYSVVLGISHLKEHPGGVLLCSSVHQEFDKAAFLLFSCLCWHVGEERPWRWLQPLHMTQQYRLASMAARLSSTGISHHNLLAHIPLIFLSAVNSSPPLGLVHNPQTPAPSCRTFQEIYVPVCGMYGWGKDYLILIPFSLPQIICFSLSLKYFSSDSDNCPEVMWRSDPCFSSPTC